MCLILEEEEEETPRSQFREASTITIGNGRKRFSLGFAAVILQNTGAWRGASEHFSSL